MLFLERLANRIRKAIRQRKRRREVEQYRKALYAGKVTRGVVRQMTDSEQEAFEESCEHAAKAGVQFSARVASDAFLQAQRDNWHPEKGVDSRVRDIAETRKATGREIFR